MKVKNPNVKRWRNAEGRLMKPFESYFMALRRAKESLRNAHAELEAVIYFFESDIDGLFTRTNSKRVRKTKKNE